MNHCYKNLDLVSFIGEREKLAFMRNAERHWPLVDSNWGCARNEMACASCYRIRHFTKFACAQIDNNLSANAIKNDRLRNQYYKDCGKQRTMFTHNCAKLSKFDEISPALINTMIASRPGATDVWNCFVCPLINNKFVNYGCPRCNKCVRIHFGHDMLDPQFCEECKQFPVFGGEGSRLHFSGGEGFPFDVSPSEMAEVFRSLTFS
ncbi:uncharacterized protein IWZ02DRAFT_459544 [Phyllosticta citriasiana]|uniref:uncharacterized protein n=1 Tax=Phyllosticta citriasiana TaxID=595635 RepID=UPI0030FD972F